MDLSNRKCRVPKVDNRIILKVTRKVAKYTLSNSNENANQNKNDSASASMSDYLL